MANPRRLSENDEARLVGADASRASDACVGAGRVKPEEYRPVRRVRKTFREQIRLHGHINRRILAVAVGSPTTLYSLGRGNDGGDRQGKAPIISKPRPPPGGRLADQRERDRPVSLRFDTLRHQAAFKEELGLTPTGTALAIDICAAPGRTTSYSRSPEHYALPDRYKSPLYTCDRMVRAADRLDALGLIHHDRRRPGERGWQSTMQPTSDLVAITQRIIGTEPPRLARPKEVILLKDERGLLIDYRDTRALDRQRRHAQQYNEALSAANLDPSIAAPVVRIYNGAFNRGGRFYAVGNSWQNLKRTARHDVKIAGETVVELDFKTLHPAMLYAQVGATPPEDCYDIPPWERDLVKIGLLTLINAETDRSARESIAHKQFAHLPDQERRAAAHALMKAIKARHRPIAHLFHQDAGARLMKRDSDMAEQMIMAMLAKGVTVLPVHDSFLVQESKADLLMAAMMEAADREKLKGLKVEKKVSA